MLHGMIPAAFFATLLRRYLDSLSECSEYTTPPPSSVGCLGTSAAIATVGMAIYGLSRLSKKKVQLQVPENNEMIRPPTPQKKEPSLRVNRKPTPKKVTRPHRKGKKWFMKHMRHYKSKYGRQIGKFMNQILGVPFTEPSITEPLDLGGSDEDDCEEDSSEVFDISSYNEDTDDRCAIANKTFIEENKMTPPKELFDDNYEDMNNEPDTHADTVRKKNSSLDLKDLLRDNFEMQKKRRNERRESSGSFQSRSSTGSYLSRCSEDTLIRHSRSSSKKNILSSKRSRSSSRSRSKKSSKRFKSKRQRSTSIPRKTRSGRCYNNSIS
ncbi:uncharacterized protein LOC123309399 isoform X2 [Coccinella septempunctata]|uniref:uncharacterized protein LOC123309399 isoform X2 n=1 Tax=Coccinella septempunctata TaxID=41139 RepID=UPI001D07405C|nr:uncharacterized protein LOC123309399 isoform X2 [Coccinella septempunctata]